MLRVKRWSIIILSWVFLFGSLIIPPAMAQKTGDQQTAKPYRDPGGLFQIVPPVGWEIKTFPEDPSLRVAFLGPDKARLSVSIHRVEAKTMDELAAYFKQLEEKNAPQTKVKTTNIKRMDFAGRPAIQRSFEYGGEKILWINFLEGSANHCLGYWAPPDKYQEHYPGALESMKTYQILK
jgi:hypothetical protein